MGFFNVLIYRALGGHPVKRSAPAAVPVAAPAAAPSPAEEAALEKRYKRFLGRLTAAEAEWAAMSFKNRSDIIYHALDREDCPIGRIKVGAWDEAQLESYRDGIFVTLRRFEREWARMSYDERRRYLLRFDKSEQDARNY